MSRRHFNSHGTREGDSEVEAVVDQVGVGEILAASSDELTPPAALRNRVLAMTEPARRFEGFEERVAKLFDFGRDRAKALLSEIGDRAGAWVEPGLRGVRLLHFDGGPLVAEADCGLVELQPGETFLAHTHHGDERFIVLQGSGLDSSGEAYHAGDLIHNEAGTSHSFTALPGEPYVIAVVLFGGFDPVV